MATKRKEMRFWCVSFWKRIFYCEVFIMHLLADNVPSITPPLQENYHNNFDTTAILIFIIFCFVLLVLIVAVCFWLSKRRSNNKNNIVKQNDTALTESELRVISEYRKLDEKGKELVNNTIQTLNSKNKY